MNKIRTSTNIEKLSDVKTKDTPKERKNLVINSDYSSEYNVSIIF